MHGWDFIGGINIYFTGPFGLIGLALNLYISLNPKEEQPKARVPFVYGTPFSQDDKVYLIPTEYMNLNSQFV